jgi:hypothetical protein
MVLYVTFITNEYAYLYLGLIRCLVPQMVSADAFVFSRTSAEIKRVDWAWDADIIAVVGNSTRLDAGQDLLGRKGCIAGS